MTITSSFSESPRFPDNIAMGSLGGPEYMTEVVVVDSGFEQRNINWMDAKARYNVAHGVKTPEQMYTLINFFRAHKGRGIGFRFKDYGDYTVNYTTDGYLKPIIGIYGATSTPSIGVVNGSPTYQLHKYYQSGSLSEERYINKPVSGTFNLYIDSTSQGTATYSLDYATGILSLTTPITTKTVSTVTVGTTTIVSFASAHSFSVSDKVYISGISGLTGLNGYLHTVSAINNAGPYTITLSTNSIGMTGTPSGGTVYKYIQSGDIRWTGEFDVPCRFDIDYMPVAWDTPISQSWNDINITEIRL